MPQIRIAYCLDSFSVGGTELNAVRTAESLDARFFDVRVVHLRNEGELSKRYRKIGAQIVHFPIKNLYSPGTVRQGLRLVSQLRSWKIDIVHSHDIYSNIFSVPWARIGTGANVLASRRWWYEAPRPELAAINRYANRFAHKIVANSESVARLLKDQEKVQSTKVQVIPNFVDDSYFVLDTEPQREARRESWGIPRNGFVVGIVARLSPVKNHEVLIRAVSQTDANVFLVIVGDGPERERLQVLADSCKISSRTIFLGEIVSRENLHQYFDLSVLCSKSEGFPNSIIEAMAAGRAIAATSVGGVPDAITDRITGRLIATDKPNEIANLIREMREDVGQRLRLGRAAREDALKRFSREAVIGQLSAFYRSLLPHANAAQGAG